MSSASQRDLRQIAKRAELHEARADGAAHPQGIAQIAPRLAQLAEPEPVATDVAERNGLALGVAQLAPDRQILQVEGEPGDLVVLLAGDE